MGDMSSNQQAEGESFSQVNPPDSSTDPILPNSGAVDVCEHDDFLLKSLLQRQLSGNFATRDDNLT